MTASALFPRRTPSVRTSTGKSRRAALLLERLEQREVPSFGAVGAEFRVNSHTTDYQLGPALASDADGDYVAVWSSLRQDGDGWGVYAQRYSSAGATLGSEFRVNSTTSDSQSQPAIGMSATGDFVIAWASGGQDGDVYGVYAQRYNSAGAPQGGEFQVNTYTDSFQWIPAVAMSAVGDFVVTWQSDGGQDGDDSGIYAQRYNADGAPQGGEFRVNSYTTSAQNSAAVAMDADGEFVVTWSSLREAGTFGIYARRYDSAGVSQGPEFRVNSYTTNQQILPTVAVDAEGKSVIAWTSFDQDGSGNGIYAQRYDASGAVSGGEFRANATTADGQLVPAVAITVDGEFVIAWEGEQEGGSPLDDSGIYARRYSATGAAIGGEVHVNTYTTDTQRSTAVTIDADGDFVVAWTSDGQDGGIYGIYSQRFSDLGNDGDTDGPAVAAVIPPGATTPLRPDARWSAPITGLVVAFTENVSIAGGATGAGSATNPANYRLTRNGTDISSRITGVVYGYNAGTNRFEAALSLDAPLTDGNYTFTARHVLRDQAGNRLDGHLDGSGFAAEFTRDFTIASPVETTPESRANSFTTNAQQAPALATDAVGNYVVVWQSFGQDGDNSGIYAQRYSAAGLPAGAEFRVNTYTTSSQSDPAVSMNAAGEFIVAWSSAAQDGSSNGVYAQRYSNAGVPVGAEFRVNATTLNAQRSPVVAMDTTGGFVVSWTSASQDGNGDGVYAQRYSPAGAPLGSEFRVNALTTGDQRESAVAIDAVGDLVVAWQSGGQDGDGNGVYAQRYSATGVALGGEFRVNNHTTGNQEAPSVGMDAAGNFVVGWQSFGQDGDGSGVYARRYNASGAALATEFRANTFTTNAQASPVVDLGAGGEFVIAWESNTQDGIGHGIYARRFSAAGLAASGEFRANTFIPSSQRHPAIAVNAAGDFALAWESFGQDGNLYGTYSRRYTRTVSVDAVRAVGTTAPIANGSVLVAPVSQLVVAVSGPLATTGVGSVRDVANWQQTRYGAAVTISNISFNFNIDTDRYEARLSFGAPLQDGRYTLTALPTILDTDGRALDGDFDGAPGGAFTLTFDVKPITASGVETDLNTFTTGNQSLPELATDSAGNYVVVWSSDGQDGDTDGVYGQRYNAAGTALGSEFRVNNYTTGDQRRAAVAMNASGAFVVTWDSEGQDGNSYGVYARRYNAGGTALGGEFRVNDYTAGNQAFPAVAMNAIGNFVVAWHSSQESSILGIYARRYDLNGNPLDDEFLVNEYLPDRQSSPAVSLNSAGDFVVAWRSEDQDGTDDGVYARQYSASGSPRGGEFRANSFTTGDQDQPRVAIAADGDFVIAWQSEGQDGNLTGIYAQRYDASGLALGNEFRINSYTTSSQRDHSLAMNAVGDFVVAWQSTGQDGGGGGIYAQRYSSGGAALGSEFRVNTTTTGSQGGPGVASNALGDFVVAWGSAAGDGDGYGLLTQRYAANLTPTTGGLPDVTIPPSPASNVNLAAGFDDIEDGAAGLTYAMMGNTNPGLFTLTQVNGSTLTLTPTGSAGSALLTIRGTDTGGSFVDASFTVLVEVGNPPRITQTQINGGAAQRSRVTSIDVTFSAQVSFAGTIASAFMLSRNGGGAVALTATSTIVGGVTVVTLNNFTGGETESGSLRDGRYTLTALQDQISAGGQQLDGDGNGVGGDNYIFGDTQGLFRYYGDTNGDRRVDISDFGFFSLAYLAPANFNPALDFNNDGRIDIADFGQFSVRFFTTLP